MKNEHNRTSKEYLKMKNTCCFLAAATAGLLLTGCLTEKTPLAISRGTFSEIKKEEHQTLPEGIKTLSLNDARQIALKNNPSFQSMRYAIEAANAQYKKAFTAYMPTVDFTYSLSRNHNWSQNPDAGTSGRGLTSKPGISASLVVFDSLQREMSILAAQHDLRGAEAAEQDARRLLLRAVAYAYNEVMLANAQIRIAKANMKFNYALLKETELKFEAGASPLSDALNFKVNYNTAESSRYSAEYSATAAKLALAQLLGLTEGIIPDSVEFPTMPSPDGEMLKNIEYYLDLALQNRPDLKQYREAYESAKYSYYSTIGAFGPTVTLNMSMNYTQGRNRTHDQWHKDSSNVSKPRSLGMNYGVNVNWELFSGGRRYFTMRAAEAGVARAEYSVANTWIAVITDVRTAYENYQTNLKLVKLNQKNLELVRKQRDLVDREYKAGSTGITRLNEAQTALIDAENALVKAVINMNNAKAQLDAATNSL